LYSADSGCSAQRLELQYDMVQSASWERNGERNSWFGVYLSRVSRPQGGIRWRDATPELSSQIAATSCTVLALDSRSRIRLFAEMRAAHGFRMEIEVGVALW
jgi:hypothetical protein